MGIVLLLQVDQFGADIADGTVLVGQLAHGHVADQRQLALGILHHMEVAIHHARHAGSIGNDRRQLGQVDTVQADGDVLPRRGVAMLGIDFDTGAIVGYQVHLDLHPVVAPKEDVVVFVEIELLVAQRRALGHEMDVQAAVNHLDLRTDARTQLVLRVEVAHAHRSAASLHGTVEEGVEHEVGVLFVITYLAAERQVVVALGQPHVDCVEQHVVDGKPVHVALAVESADRRGSNVKQQGLEIDVLTGVQERDHRIVAQALHMQGHGGQQAFDGGLVDDALVYLCHDGVGEGFYLLQ